MFDQLFGMILLGLGIQSPFSQSVKGDSTTISTESILPTTGTREERKIRIHEVKESAKKEKEIFKARLKNTRFTIDEHSEASREAYREAVKQSHEAFAQEVEQKREEIKTLLETQHEAFKEKVATIRDEKKKMTVENIQDRMTKLNQERTDIMAKHVSKMSEIVGSITEKTEEQKIAGSDVSRILAAITSSEEAISAAQTAVTSQAGKTYVVTITSETNLKSDVETVRRTMVSDLKKTQEKIIIARKAVSLAIIELAKSRGEVVVPREVIQ